MKVAGLTLALATTGLAQMLPTLQEVLANTSSLSQLANLAAPYLSSLAQASANGSMTVLAPNNAAVGAFLNSSAAASVNNTALVQALLSYHILPGNYTTVPNTTFIPTALQLGNYSGVTGGQRVEAIAANGSFSLVSGLLQKATVNGSAIQFQGGVLHILNEFLTVPQNVTATAIALNLTSAVGAFGALNLTQTLVTTPDLTFFIPNNAAFQRVGGNLANLSMMELTSILEYHVVRGPPVLYSTALMNGSSVQSLQGTNLTARIIGSDVYVGNAKVLVPNVLVGNGVVHVIDRLLSPSNATATPNTSTTQDAFASPSSASNVPYTSGVPTPTSANPTASAPNATGGSKSSSAGAWQPAATGAIGMGALFGGAAIVMNNL